MQKGSGAMRPIICLLLLQHWMIFSGSELYAQSDVAVASPGTNEAATMNPAETSEKAGSILFRTPQGQLVPVTDLLGKGIVEEILQRVEEQRNEPRFTVSQLEVSGEVDQDEVRLKIDLQIQVNSTKEWVTVPLALGDVYLAGPPKAVSSAVDGQSMLTTGEQNTQQWHLRGKGLHTISMDLVGKTRVVSPGVSQISLNLPAAPISHAIFRFSGPVELLKLPASTVDKTTRDDQGVRTVEFWGPGPGFGMTWSQVVSRITQKPVIQVQNRMKLDLTTIPVTLTGTQVLQISGSPVSEIQVTFPAGFQLVEADARNAAGVSVLNNFESPPTDGPVAALYRLTSALEGTLTLSFDLELTGRQFPQDIKVSMPSVRDAGQQPGDLDILAPTGLLVQQTELRGVQRIRVTSEADLSVAATAFRMRSPESLIVLHVEETEAQFAVSPELSLKPDPQNVLMTVRYPVNVLKGSLLDLSIIWPGYSSNEWQIVPGTLRLETGKNSFPLTRTTSEADKDLLQVTFPERQSGQFSVVFSAYAPLAEVRSGAIQLRCPEVATRRAQPFVIRTIESDEYSVRPINMGTGELLPSVPVAGSLTGGGVDDGLKSESWLHDDPTNPIRLELPAQAPSVNAEITVGMQPRENGIEVQELIHFEIEHRDLTSLQLQVPDGIRRPTVRIAGTTEPLRGTIESSNWSFRLPESRRGSLDVEVTYLWSSPLEAAQPMNHVYQLPVIIPESTTVLSILAGTSSFSGLRVPDDSTWSPVYSETFESAMQTTQPVTVIPIQWTDRMALTASISPDLIFVGTTIIGGQAITSTLAVYDSAPDSLVIETPEDLKLETILLGDRTLRASGTDSVVMPPQRIPDRRVTRRTIAVDKIDGIGNGPVLFEIRVREKLPETKALWLSSLFRRASIVGESGAVPVVWCVGSQDEFQAVSASGTFLSLTQRGATILPGGETVRSLADRQLLAVVSPYSEKLQNVIIEQADEWLGQPGRHDLFFGASESGALKLYLVPHVALLLISALTCVLFYLISWLFRGLTITAPILFLICFGLAAWLFFPERTLIVAPYIAMGVLFGFVSATIQRMTSERRMRFSGSSKVNEYPTVFGFSGVMTSPLPDSGGPISAQNSRASDVTAGSAG
jgi:hypothetical protein